MQNIMNINLEMAFDSSTTPYNQNWPPTTVDTAIAWPPNQPDTDPPLPYDIISMAYGYTKSTTPGKWWSMFQKVPKVTANGCQMSFFLVDTADMTTGTSPLFTISQIVIYVAKYNDVDPTKPSSNAVPPPFASSRWPSQNPYYLIIDSSNANTWLSEGTGLNGSPTGGSTGVNVQGRYWRTAPFFIVNPGYYEFTVGVYGKLKGPPEGPLRVFSIDPEMVVDGSN